MIVVIALVLLLLGTFGTADAQLLFDFSWTSTASFSTLVRVDRVEPDGSITPYDQVRIDGTRTGSGLLVLAPVADGEGRSFSFSGTGGSGSGTTLAGGEILPGQLSFALPPDVPVHLPGNANLSGGFLALAGPAQSPTGLSISYFEGASPHCQFGCSSITFSGSGVRHAAPVTAAEPSSILLVGLAMLTLARLRSRRK